MEGRRGRQHSQNLMHILTNQVMNIIYVSYYYGRDVRDRFPFIL